MIDCVHCGNPYEGESCPHGCGSADAEADVQRVLDIAYGRELYAALDETQDVPALDLEPGVYLVTRHYGYRCDGGIRPGPANPPQMWLKL